MQEGKRSCEPREKPAEASTDWKPNAHAALGPEIEPRLSGAQKT